MTDRYAVTLTATGSVLRWGNGTSDPTFDPATETLSPIDAPPPAMTQDNMKYFTVASALVVAMDQTQRDAVDVHDAPIIQAAKEAQIAAQLTSDPLNGLTVTAVAVLLAITVNIETLVANDVTNVVASGTDTKFVKVCYVYDSTGAGSFSVKAYEKTTGNYAAFTPPEYLVRQLGEWSVVANGTVLVEV